MYQTSKFFSKSACFLKKCQKDDNYCIILLACLLTLAEKIGNQDMPEAKYFEDNLSVFEDGLKNLADPSEYTRTFQEIKNILDQIINPDNYPAQEPRPSQIEEFMPKVIFRLK